MALREALDIAPTYAAALQYLGNLQCEAGRADEGLVRLRLAYALDPGLVIALLEVARISALRGKMDDYRWAAGKLMAQPLLRLPALILRMRTGAWTGDLEEVRRCRQELRDDASGINIGAVQYADAVLGEATPGADLSVVDSLLADSTSLRFMSLLCQLATEQLCLTGQAERAMGYFQRAADTALIDMEWIERCPVLAPLRGLPGFAEGRRKVRTRVEALWIS
jgi:serine/threonine-protein kinase